MDHTVVTRSATKARQSTAGVDSKDSLSQKPSPKRKLDSTEPTPEHNPPSSKRTKNASQTFAKHSRFWALDGNVILQFDAVAFKVHRSRLATQSVWFEKLFEKRAGREEPLEWDEEEINDVVVEDIEGVDVYHLDSVGSMEDFEALLSAMEDAINFYYAPPPFLALAAIFRAATIYKFHKFVEFTRQYLLDIFPNDLSNFTGKPVPYPAAAVILGREWDLPAILKRAFYELLRAQPEGPPAAEEDEIPSAAMRFEGLKMDDIIRVAETQKHITAVWLTVLSARSPISECPAKTPCSATRRAGWATIAEILQKYRFDPICGLDELIAVQWTSIHGFCKTCAAKQKSSFVGKKAKIWEEMDAWLNIPVEDEEEDGHGA